MNIQKMVKKIQNHPDSDRIGMIVTHLGIVRGTSRDGRVVTRIDVTYDHNILKNIINDIRSMSGIIEVMLETKEGLLEIGDEIMLVAVGGDIRENVFAALMETVNRIKKEAARKKEYFQ